MVIYTIYPHETVFEAQEEEKRNLFSVDFEGRTFVLEFSNGQAQIVRLISPDPRDYHNPRWQPGTKLSFTLPETQT